MELEERWKVGNQSRAQSTRLDSRFLGKVPLEMRMLILTFMRLYLLSFEWFLFVSVSAEIFNSKVTSADFAVSRLRIGFLSLSRTFFNSPPELNGSRLVQSPSLLSFLRLLLSSSSSRFSGQESFILSPLSSPPRPELQAKMASTTTNPSPLIKKPKSYPFWLGGESL